ncbi:hypothetical protein Sjap_004757 [Stephania japonica]|uniref:Uncharacterized protein n=1 Tax=Stephania japonica TaxID=461633 RepID=A0AAP0K449_9MAGN
MGIVLKKLDILELARLSSSDLFAWRPALSSSSSPTIPHEKFNYKKIFIQQSLHFSDGLKVGSLLPFNTSATYVTYAQSLSLD